MTLKILRIYAVLPLFLLVVLLTAADRVFGWGFWAHKEINKRAVDLLPSKMKPFFLTHADYLSEHAVDPDIRRSSDTLEQYHHYIDIDYYGKYPFTELPRNYDSAVTKFGVEVIRKQGVVPWRIAALTDSLSRAMKQKDENRILGFAADLGHYVADSHVPLHAVMDYDGVQRGQKGIHKRWESEMTERFGKSYGFPSKGIFFIENPLMYAFGTILESYTYADSIFAAEEDAVHSTPDAKKVQSVRQPGDTVYTFSDTYYESLRIADRGLAERRMRKAILSVASLWYTAWISAGKPELSIYRR